jgi:hypothetical protein
VIKLRQNITKNRAHKFFSITTMSSHSGSRGGGWPRTNFEQYKDIIYNLYLINRQSLDDVRRYMQSCYNFNLRYIDASFFLL